MDQYDTDGAVEFTLRLMYGRAEPAEVLRLLVLLCATHNGVPRKAYDALRQARGPLLSR